MFKPNKMLYRAGIIGKNQPIDLDFTLPKIPPLDSISKNSAIGIVKDVINIQKNKINYLLSSVANSTNQDDYENSLKNYSEEKYKLDRLEEKFNKACLGMNTESQDEEEEDIPKGDEESDEEDQNPLEELWKDLKDKFEPEYPRRQWESGGPDA
ncbi:MAG: hypothetical protein PHV68_05560 [Candidatus Gastranaerophilales bacterium]|nr:hypothetical protein [Candidatus Gastranaerophilales bacterium]